MLEYCKTKIAEKIELNNSILYGLENDPYPNESFTELSSSQESLPKCRQPHDSVDSIDRSLSSATKKFLFSPVAFKSNLKKPRVQNSKTKTNNIQMKPAVQKILIQNIKVKVVNSNKL
jgi:uncharacterized transporter YbjL